MTHSLRLLVGFVVGCAFCVVQTARALPVVDGTKGSADRGVASAVAAVDWAAIYEMVRARHASDASADYAHEGAAIPAFARKYGMKCSACHQARSQGDRAQDSDHRRHHHQRLHGVPRDQRHSRRLQSFRRD